MYQPVSCRDEATLDQLRDLAPDVIVVAAYGKLLPEALLNIPRLATINVHSSILPQYRGAAPGHREGGGPHKYDAQAHFPSSSPKYSSSSSSVRKWSMCST